MNDLIAVGVQRSGIRSWFFLWLASVVRGNYWSFPAWSTISLGNSAIRKATVGFSLVWNGNSFFRPGTICVNGHFVRVRWQRLNERVSVSNVIPRSVWYAHENTLAAGYFTDWSKLSILPVREADEHHKEEVLLESRISNTKERSVFRIDQVVVNGDSDFGKRDQVQINGATGFLDATPIGFMLRSINSDPCTPFRDLCYGCYDLTNQVYRLASWIWTNSIIIASMLEDERETSSSFAQQLGKVILPGRIVDGANIGAFMVRHDPVHDVSQGFAEWLAPNDAALLGGYGFIPLYRATGDVNYLNAAIGIAEWIIREGMRRGRLRVGYRLEQGRWDDSWLYLDAGFTPVLFARLYEVEQRPEWKQVCELIMDDLLRRLYGGNGRLFSAWLWPGRKGKAYFARGYAWFLDGLLHAYRCTGRSDYLEIARRCAQLLMSSQHSNGAWHYLLDRPNTGFCNKGTPAIALQLLRLYQLTQEEELKFGARQALDWCKENQYSGEDLNAQGGIVSWNTEGSIVGAKNIQTAFPYASGFQVLAESLWEKL